MLLPYRVKVKREGGGMGGQMDGRRLVLWLGGKFGGQECRQKIQHHVTYDVLRHEREDNRYSVTNSLLLVS